MVAETLTATIYEEQTLQIVDIADTSVIYPAPYLMARYNSFRLLCWL